jgi:hypothetical protein
VRGRADIARLVLVAVLCAVAASGCVTRRTVYRPVPPPQPRQTPPTTVPPEYVLGLYNAGLTQDREFRATPSDKVAAEKALALFAEYLQLAPFGEFAISAHLRKARLHCALGQQVVGLGELDKVRRHPDRTPKDLQDVQYVANLCNGRVSGPCPPGS